MRIAIKGCKIFDRGDSKFDIIIEEDRIKQILPSVGANYSGFTEIEAGGLVALPGLFDIHCHQRAALRLLRGEALPRWRACPTPCLLLIQPL
jgi:dihydroorotase-like cyclic amidohydrolase